MTHAQEHAHISEFLKARKDPQKKYEVDFTDAFETVKDLLAIGFLQNFGTGLTYSDQAELAQATQIALNIAKKIILPFKPLIAKEKDITEMENQMGVDMWHQLHLEYGSIVKEVGMEVKKMNCAAFAFKYCKDPDISPYLIKDAMLPSMFTQNYGAFLAKLNYVNVEFPNTGDLVVYFKKEKGVDEVTHLGVYLENGKVISKQGGINLPYIYEHDLYISTDGAGTLIQFFRKK